MELRNRLAHAKEKEIPVDGSCSPHMDAIISETALQELRELIKASDAGTLMANFFQELPEPDLMLELKAPKINEHLDTIRTSALWLDLMYKSYCRTIHVRVSSPKS